MFHYSTSFPVQIAVEPQGSTWPVLVTGKPISSRGHSAAHRLLQKHPQKIFHHRGRHRGIAVQQEKLSVGRQYAPAQFHQRKQLLLQLPHLAAGIFSSIGWRSMIIPSYRFPLRCSLWTNLMRSSTSQRIGPILKGRTPRRFLYFMPPSLRRVHMAYIDIRLGAGQGSAAGIGEQV